MHVVMFYHSLVSDWNHGNAHFLRGVTTELLARGHRVTVYEPRSGWSVDHLLADVGPAAIDAFHAAYPALSSHAYDLPTLDLDEVLDDADLVLVHEWNDHHLVRRIGEHRRDGGRYRLLFHDTHHRAVSDPTAMAAYDLRHYDGVLAFGRIIRDLYLERGWAQRSWTWHEAADVRVFRPRNDPPNEGGLVWVGNWGDGERTAELRQFLFEPAADLRLRGSVYGVRYPDDAIDVVHAAGLRYRGWLANFEAPAVFARHRLTVHVPRGPYVRDLPGIPTIRPFEAMACGIPLISAPWDDLEGLFRAGTDYLLAPDGAAMRRHMRGVLDDPAMAAELAANGLARIRERHTCGHRVDELLAIHADLTGSATRRIYA